MLTVYLILLINLSMMIIEISFILGLSPNHFVIGFGFIAQNCLALMYAIKELKITI